MNKFISILYHLKVLPIKKKHLEQWYRDRDVEYLIMASKIASPAIRIMAVEKFRHLGMLSKTVIQHLVTLMTDQNLQVAEQANDVLVSKLMPRELEDNASYQEAVKVLNENKAILESRLNYFKETSKGFKPLRKNTSDMKRLKQLKKQLKRPMR